MYIYIKYYLRSFLLFWFIFIIIPAIRTYFMPSPYISLGEVLLIGLVIAAAASLILGSLHIHSVRKSNPGADLDKALKVFHTKCIEIDETFEAAYDKSVACLQELQKYKIKEMDPAKGWIKAKTGLSWESFGETVTLSVEFIGREQQESKYQVGRC